MPSNDSAYRRRKLRGPTTQINCRRHARELPLTTRKKNVVPPAVIVSHYTSRWIFCLVSAVRNRCLGSAGQMFLFTGYFSSDELTYTEVALRIASGDWKASDYIGALRYGIKRGRVSGGMSVTDDVANRLLRLPLYFELTSQDVDRIAASIKAFFE
jgi:hypothetical protein